jgi:hypothetical protein
MEDIWEARRTGMGWVSLDSNVKNGELPLTHAKAPESIRTVSDGLAEALIARTQTLTGLEEGGGFILMRPEFTSRISVWQLDTQ